MTGGDSRLPAHLEVSGLIRAVEASGGFATVVAKGERDAGTILIVCFGKDRDSRIFERMPQMDGSRSWTLAKEQDPENPHDFWDYCDRRKKQDEDLWILELDIENPERFIELT